MVILVTPEPLFHVQDMLYYVSLYTDALKGKMLSHPQVGLLQ
jgi:hypothetical protein